MIQYSIFRRGPHKMRSDGDQPSVFCGEGAKMGGDWKKKF